MTDMEIALVVMYLTNIGGFFCILELQRRARDNA